MGWLRALLRPWVPVAAMPCALLAALVSLPKSPRGTLEIVFSGEMNGYLAPCGCAKPMLGGMERRGAFLARLRRNTTVLLLEHGDLVSGTGRQDELKAETLMAMLSALGYSAFCPGEKDLAMGLATLVRLEGRSRVPFVCANVTDGAGNPVFRKHARADLRLTSRRLRVAIAGLMSPQVFSQAGIPPEEFRVLPPDGVLISLRRVLAPFDVRVLLYHGPRPEAAEIARRFPAFSLIVYAHGADGPVEPDVVGGTVLVSGGTRGKHLGRAVLAPGAGAGGWKLARRINWQPLTEALGADPSMARFKERYLARIAAENLLGNLPRRPQPEGMAYAGSEVCKPCHAGAFRTWQQSRHARAFATLTRAHEDRDPECVSCHVTGLDVEGGYTPGDRRLAAVGCESCHGMAAAHAVSGAEPLPARSGPASCDRCHVPDHSPAFRFDTYWARIRH